MVADRITLAMTGASGMPYGLRLLECLIDARQTVDLVMSPAARIVIQMETEHRLPPSTEATNRYFEKRFRASEGQLRVFAPDQWTAPMASGSAVARAMVVCPCTSGTLAAIATGTSDSLLERAADVVIKEGRRLILVHREMPVSAIHLEHMLKLARLGVTIMPAAPGFYERPRTVDDLVDFVVARILDHLDIPQTLVPPWGGANE